MSALKISRCRADLTVLRPFLVFRQAPYADRPAAVNASIYAQTCVAVSKAVKALNPAIRVGCVGDIADPAHPRGRWSHGVWHDAPFPDWQADVLAGAEAAMDFLIIHEYYTKVYTKAGAALPEDLTPWGLLNYGCASAATVGGPNCGPAAVAAAVKRAASGPLDVMITEWNIMQPIGPPAWQLVQGTRASTSFWRSPRGCLSSAPPHTRWVVCSTWWPCVWDAD